MMGDEQGSLVGGAVGGGAVGAVPGHTQQVLCAKARWTRHQGVEEEPGRCGQGQGWGWMGSLVLCSSGKPSSCRNVPEFPGLLCPWAFSMFAVSEPWEGWQLHWQPQMMCHREANPSFYPQPPSKCTTNSP